MKKALFVLLSVLLITVSFTSCQKDTSGDIVALYETFMSAHEDLKDTCAVWPDEKGQVGNSLTTNQISSTRVRNAVRTLSEDTTINISGLTDASGSVFYSSLTSGNTTTQTWDFDKVKIDYNYTSKTVTEKTAGTLEFDGKYTVETTGNTVTKTYDMTINSNSYNISFTYNSNTYVVSSATCNGQSVETKLINARNKIE